MNNLNFEQLPDKITGSLEEGIHKLTIINCEPMVAKSTGSTMLQFTYQIDDTNFKLKFDNCVLFNKDGTPNEFGRAKLKKILKAIDLIPQGDFSPKILAGMIMNSSKSKSFQANLIKDKNSEYLVMGHLDTILPLSETGNLKTITPESFMEQQTETTLGEFVKVEPDESF